MPSQSAHCGRARAPSRGPREANARRLHSTLPGAQDRAALCAMLAPPSRRSAVQPPCAGVGTGNGGV